MATLRSYPPAQINAAIQAVYEKVEDGLMPPDRAGSILKFRDDRGAYWTVGLRGGTWYQHVANSWASGYRPQGNLEAVADLALHLPHQAAAGKELPALEAISDPIQGIAAYVRRIMNGYQAGLLDSDGAEMFLRELVLQDGQGRLWVNGARSGHWYSLEGGHWHPSDGQPSMASTGQTSGAVACAHCGQTVDAADAFCRYCGQAPLKRESFAAGAALFADSSAGGYSLPEPVTAPWKPPSSYPEALACSRCGKTHLAESRFCTFCGNDVSPAGQKQAERVGASGMGASGMTGSAVEATKLKTSDAPSARQAPPARSDRPDAPAAPSGKRHCRSCGSAHRPSLNFCTKCGTLVQ
jgi:uncharacterized OB-fold protein